MENMEKMADLTVVHHAVIYSLYKDDRPKKAVC